MIVGGTNNYVYSNYSMSIGGILQGSNANNTISATAPNSVAIGNRVSLLAPSTFAWSDFEPDIYDNYTLPIYFTGTQSNTSIARSYNGFAINKVAPTIQNDKVVNLTVGGAISLLDTPLRDANGVLLYSGANYS